MQTEQQDELYEISFSPQFSWALTADPKLRDWIDHFGSVMGLSKNRLSPSHSRILVQPESAPPVHIQKKTGIRRIENYYARYTYCPEELSVAVTLLEQSGDDPKSRTLSFKALIITLAALMQQHGAIFLHAATLVKNDEAVIIAASSGGGKSTTASRVPPPWHAPGDECCIALRDSDGYVVHVIPTWSAVLDDTHRSLRWDTKKSYRLRAFCVLMQDTKDEICRIGPAQSIAAITSSARQAAYIQLDRSGKDMNQLYFSECYRSAEEMSRTIPSYILRTTLTGQFWKILEEELW